MIFMGMNQSNIAQELTESDFNFNLSWNQLDQTTKENFIFVLGYDSVTPKTELHGKTRWGKFQLKYMLG